MRDFLLEGRRLRSSEMIFFTTSQGKFDKGLTLDSLSGYGCYGTPHERKLDQWVGKGKPVDLIDELNQKLTHCYRCLGKAMDFNPFLLRDKLY